MLIATQIVGCLLMLAEPTVCAGGEDLDRTTLILQAAAIDLRQRFSTASEGGQAASLGQFQADPELEIANQAADVAASLIFRGRSFEDRFDALATSSP